MKVSISRHSAAAIHLALSATVVLSLLTVMLLRWYPGIWFEAMGGRHLIFILAGVDITLGPLLTWIVFKPGKKTLKLDLSVIAGLQIAALFYGLHILYEARPAFLVFVDNQFRAVSAAEVDPVLQKQSQYLEFHLLPDNGPRLATAELPSDPGERQTLIQLLAWGIDLHQLPQFWRPYDGQAALRTATPLEQLREIDAANGKVLDDYLAKNSVRADTLRFLPLRTRQKEMAVIIDAKTGDFSGIIDAKPWR